MSASMPTEMSLQTVGHILPLPARTPVGVRFSVVEITPDIALSLIIKKRPAAKRRPPRSALTLRRSGAESGS